MTFVLVAMLLGFSGLPSDAVEWWHAGDLEECSCVYVDEWIGRINGTSLSPLGSSPAWDPFGLGQLPIPPNTGSGHAVLFDGVDDAMATGAVLGGEDSQVTVYAVIGWTGSGREALLFIGEDAFGIYLDDGAGDFGVCASGDDTTWGDHAPYGLTVVAVSMSGCEQRVWVNGVERTAYKSGFSGMGLEGWLVVGARAREPEGNDLVDFGAFRLGDLLIFNRAHSECEAEQVRAALLSAYD